MTIYAQRIKNWIQKKQVDAEILSFAESVHSVADAIAASGYPIEKITKTIIMITQTEELVIAMVPAEHRASTERVRKSLALSERPRIATPDEIENRTGQQAGGNSPLNVANAKILLDPKILEKDWLITGGGDDRHLIKISTAELKKVITYTETRVRK